MTTRTSKRQRFRENKDSAGHRLAKNLREIRRARGWTQEYVVDQINQLGYQWSRATLSQVEQFGRQIMIDEWFALSLIFGFAPMELIEKEFVSSITTVAFERH